MQNSIFQLCFANLPDNAAAHHNLQVIRYAIFKSQVNIVNGVQSKKGSEAANRCAHVAETVYNQKVQVVLLYSFCRGRKNEPGGFKRRKYILMFAIICT